MKYLMLTAAFLALSISASAQQDAITKYFQKYAEDTSFTTVYVSSKMFQMIAKLGEGMEEEEAEMFDIIKDLKGLRILTTDRNGLRYYKEAMRTIDTKGYEVLMTVRDGEQNVRFWVKEKGNTIDELLLLVGGTNEFVLMSFAGKIDLNKIAKLSKSVDINGMEHLEKIEKN